MPTYTTVRDPRSIVTPEAFQVAEELLGMPLATPRRRFAAVVVDLAVIGVLTLVTSSFALILGAVVAAAFIRLSIKQAPVEGSAFHRAMRFSLGCLGLFIGGVTALIWLAVGSGVDLEFSDGDAPPSVVTESGEGSVGLRDLAGFLGGSVGLLTAETRDEAREAMVVVVRRGRAVASSDTDIRGSILEMVPDERSWAEDAPAMLDSILALEGAAPAEPPPDAAEADPEAADPAEPASEVSTPALLEEYAVLLRRQDVADAARLDELRLLLLEQVAADTLTVLENEVTQLQDIAEARLGSVEDLQQALEEAEEGGGAFGWLRSFVDELGFGFGWASLYMTVLLSWWKGQTVGKKLLGIRVVRLDGQPLTWWVAFERAGGYAAGFATGLLGFAQVWWDANRQAIHDRIVGTVVLREGAARVDDWESAL